ncbi:hypothetical protein ABW19_dt0208756 [Dactylella cylindrospora]|nr:hypothetical protein ABW19_dt0208756 [Dactylella cylindrospora]
MSTIATTTATSPGADASTDTTIEEANATAAEELQEIEASTWVPHVAAGGIASHQILYKLAPKAESPESGGGIKPSYFVAIHGSDLEEFLVNDFSRSDLLTKDGVYFVSFKDLASCIRAKKNGNRPLGVDNPGEIDLFNVSGTPIRATIVLQHGSGYKNFRAGTSKEWTVFATTGEAEKYNKEQGGGRKGVVFPSSGAGFELIRKEDTDKLNGLDEHLNSGAWRFALKSGFFYENPAADKDYTTILNTKPSREFTWFRRLVVPALEGSDTAAPKSGLYVRLHMSDFNISTLRLDIGSSKGPRRCYIENEHFKSIWGHTWLAENHGELQNIPERPPTKPKAGEGKDEMKKEEKEKASAASSSDPKKRPVPRWNEVLFADEDVHVTTRLQKVFYRDEAGKVFAKDTSDAMRVRNFMEFYYNGTTRPDYQNGRFPRAVDMKNIKIYIHQLITDETRFGLVKPGEGPRESLYNIFARVHEEGNMQTEFAFFDSATKTENIPKTYTLLSRSCFGDFDTYIETVKLEQYLDEKVTKERKYPGDLDVDVINKLRAENKKIDELAEFNKMEEGKAEGDKVNEYKNFVNTSTAITAVKIDNAKGTRSSAPGQAAVMSGISASDVARVLGWDAMRTTPINNWDKERFAMAEWLHRCGYAFGGLSDAASPGSSQTPQNLIFGTSETNSIMTRYEDVYRNAILRERNLAEELRAIYEGKQVVTVTGRLRTQLANGAGRLRLKDGGYIREAVSVPRWSQSSGPTTWVKLGERYPWICGELSYKFSLQGQGDNANSKMFNGATEWTTSFFPFDRLFFTRLEAVVDDQISLTLYKQAVYDAQLAINPEKAAELVAGRKPYIAKRKREDVEVDKNPSVNKEAKEEGKGKEKVKEKEDEKMPQRKEEEELEEKEDVIMDGKSG